MRIFIEKITDKSCTSICQSKSLRASLFFTNGSTVQNAKQTSYIAKPRPVMRAHIARHVCRRALLLRQSHTSRCPLLLSQPRLQPPRSSFSPRQTQKRTLFGIFQKAPRQIKKPEYEPGWTVILTWRNRLLENVRPPTRTELVEAFRELLTYKDRFGIVVNSTQARHCRNLLTYLVENKDDEPGEGLTLLDLLTARDALFIIPKEDTSEHLEFSKALYAEIKKQRELGHECEQYEDNFEEDAFSDDFSKYVLALTSCGASKDAYAALREVSTQLHSTSSSADAVWLDVLRGLATEGLETELLEAAAEAEDKGVLYGREFHHTMTCFYASKDRVKEARKWFSRPIAGGDLPAYDTYKQLLLFSFRTKQRDWINQVFQELVDANPTKSHWDVVYQWAVSAMGKGLDDLRAMFDVVAKHNPNDTSVLPDVDTINDLIRTAIEQNDPYLADRLVPFAADLGIEPDATTFILQLESRIQAKDLSAAKLSYKQLQAAELVGEEDLPVLNKYLQALCDAPKPDLKGIREILDVLEQRVVTLNPDTVVALCTIYLKYDQQLDIIDTLSLNIFQHSIDQRQSVRDAFVSYCLDRKNSTARVWDSYSILRQFFLETPVEDRLKLMGAFFDRKRPDMAVHVFGHMRQHANRSFHPSSEAYIQCFEGLGRCGDLDAEEHLALVHNMLKMDLGIQPSTRLYNALMLAYSSCGQAARALDFWYDINRSAEGPSYKSLEIVFSVCENMPYGDQKAKEIWTKIQKLEVDVPPSIFAAYVGGLAGNGNIPSVQNALETMQQVVGYGPDMLTLGVAYNAMPGQGLQRKFADWANEAFPQAWAEVKKRRYYRASNGLVKYKLPRELTA